MTVRRRLETLVRLRSGDQIACRVDDGTRLDAEVLVTEHDQTGVRVVAIPPGVSRDSDRCRLRANRFGSEWGAIVLENRRDDGWEQYGEVVELDTDEADR